MHFCRRRRHVQKITHCGAVVTVSVSRRQRIRRIFARCIEDVNAPAIDAGEKGEVSVRLPSRNASGAAEVTSMLLAAGTEAEVGDTFWFTTLMFAASTGYDEVLALRIKRGGANCEGLEKTDADDGCAERSPRGGHSSRPAMLPRLARPLRRTRLDRIALCRGKRAPRVVGVVRGSRS